MNSESASLHLPWETLVANVWIMSTITAILEMDADGTLHLPVPQECKAMRIKVIATLEPMAASESSSTVRAKTDFAVIREELWGPNRDKRRFTAEDSAFIRDRGER